MTGVRNPDYRGEVWLAVLAIVTSAGNGGYGLDPTIVMARIDTTFELGLTAVLILSATVLVVIKVLEKASVLRDRGFAGLVGSVWRKKAEPGEPGAPGTLEEGTGFQEPSEYLTDEELVMRVIEENNGQVRQRRIVEETGWSKSKVSRLLSRMEEDGLIQKLSLGRENLIMAPGESRE